MERKVKWGDKLAGDDFEKEIRGLDEESGRSR